MPSELVIATVAAALSALAGGFLPVVKALLNELAKRPSGRDFFLTAQGKSIAKLFGIGAATESPESLFAELRDTSEKMDDLVRKIQEFSSGREEAILKLENQLGLMSKQEQELSQRINNLKDVPLPAAEYFATLVSKGEGKSAKRDYALFLLGVIVSSIIAVLLKKFGIV